MQIEARVDQQTDISSELTLWGQRGSRVIRGNLLAIPVNDSFIFVEPVYLEAKQEERELPEAQPPLGNPQRRRASFPSELEKSMAAALPELKRVIVAFSNRLIMEENLDKALGGIFGKETFPRELTSPLVSETSNIYTLVAPALEHYNKAQDYLSQRNWTGYGAELENLEKVLKEMSRITKERK